MKTTDHGQLLLSIGALLAAEREKRGIPVEKAAKETRMRPQRIRDMEGDDLSHFTNPSYARMFIIAYAKYLGVPMQTICDHLPDRGELGTEGYQYISTSTEDLPSLRQDIASKPARRSTSLLALVVVTLAAVLIGMGGLSYYLIVNANRLTAVVDKPPPTPEPTPEPVAPPKPVTLADMGLSNLNAEGKKTEAFEGQVTMDVPPTPVPVTVVVEKPTPTQDATAAPADPAPDDHAFLLGASPDQKPPAVP